MSEPTTRILQAQPMMSMLQDDLARDYFVVPFTATDSAADLAERGRGVAIAVTTGEAGLGAEQLRALPDLRAIVNFGAGYDSSDIATARRQGVVVSNTPDVLTDCVADLAVGLVIDTLRRVSLADRFLRAGHWANGPFPLAARVTGKRIGIVGLGRIGLAIAHRLRGFDVAISYHNRRPKNDVAYDYLASVEELAAWCDVLIVTAPGGPDSRGLISADVLRALGPAGYLVNIARGSVVDEPALVQALMDGTIAGAGLDVFADEPNVPEALTGLDNVVLTPHIGSGTVESRRAMADLVLANIQRFRQTGALVTPVPEQPA
ncbi:2-hydroxyacid dehydrogenase [Cryobacterium tepidiphilum]|uniref:2-hydroxyacid dehydrogenase n=1 Tax=Cryobacterium tepidiphilum TaxID=2486026 RepID=A0A3M8LPG9_9MICO|nr:2-hydroxyacid dehydrogenase [Cryobacterium tepidiphilum]RNE66709.1 2-hydroxyacid dehydrogenase [Cryobacterium tepidiphilum]